MTAALRCTLRAFLLACVLGTMAHAEEAVPVVRIAELEIDPAHLAAYTAAVREEIETSIRVEPGVRAIYSVAIKGQDNHLRFFEIYADNDAYRRHIDSLHFRKYVEVTKGMIRSRTLLETVPLVLGSK